MGEVKGNAVGEVGIAPGGFEAEEAAVGVDGVFTAAEGLPEAAFDSPLEAGEADVGEAEEEEGGAIFGARLEAGAGEGNGLAAGEEESVAGFGGNAAGEGTALPGGGDVEEALGIEGLFVVEDAGPEGTGEEGVAEGIGGLAFNEREGELFGAVVVERVEFGEDGAGLGSEFGGLGGGGGGKENEEEQRKDHRGRSSGMVTMNSAPGPEEEGLSRRMEPPRRRRFLVTMARPRPVPLWRVVK